MSEEKKILLIDEEYTPPLTTEEAEALKPIMQEFVDGYLDNKDRMTIDEWLDSKLTESLPEHDHQELVQARQDIVGSLRIQEEKLHSVQKAYQTGRSPESWFASEAKRAISYMSAQEAGRYLSQLDAAMKSANEAMERTIHTQAGLVSQNPNLDGFIAEQYHAQTFNLNAAARGSQYRAEVLEPGATGYSKNSVDIQIKDANGTVRARYQSKYCKDVKATEGAFDQGDYRGQQKLVPEDQLKELKEQGIKATDRITAPDGTSSNPLEKPVAKEMQEQAQSGNWNELNWNEYQLGDLAKGIGVRAGKAALLGAAIGVGFNVAQKVWKGENIEGSELLKTALVSGADFGLKTVIAGALKVGSEKGIIKLLPKGTPIETITGIVQVGIENVKIVGKMAKGELSLEEGVECMEQVTVSTLAGIAASAKGAVIGASIGTVLGPVGSAIGGFIGGTIGYMAGSYVGETIVKQAQKVRKKLFEGIACVGKKLKGAVSAVGNRLRSLARLFG